MMSTACNNDDIKTAIGNLLLRASTNKIATKVLTAYEPSAKHTANSRALSSFNVELLEEAAHFLGIKLADSDGLKLFTKETLISRIILAIRALFPTTCSVCSEGYASEFDPAEPPLFTCFMCFRDSHNCSGIKAAAEMLEESVVSLPIGI